MPLTDNEQCFVQFAEFYAALEDPVKAAVVGTCAAVGAYSILRSTAGLLSSFNRHFLRGTYKMYERYGDAQKESYSVVTGGSDGIGLEICRQTA